MIFNFLFTIFNWQLASVNRKSPGRSATDQVPSAASVPVPSGPSPTDEVAVMIQLGGWPETLLKR